MSVPALTSIVPLLLNPLASMPHDTHGGTSNPVLGMILFITSEVMFFAGLFAAYFSIRAAFVYGSIAKGQDTAASDIDLMVISDRLTYADLFAALEEASTQLGRKIAPTIYSSEDLSTRVKQDNSFVTRVLAQPKLWLIGDESALAA